MNAGEQGPRYFTLEDANRLLPRLRVLLTHMQQAARQLAELQHVLSQLSGRRPAPTGDAAPAGYTGNGRHERLASLLQRAEQLSAQLQAGAEELVQLGCELKDLDRGLVDFRTMRDGRDVYLCWRLGEGEISYWHELTAGYSGRHPL